MSPPYAFIVARIRCIKAKRSAVTDHELVNTWESLNLPIENWTHRSHVRVAFTYLQRHAFAEALAKMRAGIKAYNAANGISKR